MPARLQRRMARFASLAMVVVIAASLTGCNQLSAKRNLSRLQRIFSEILVHEGDDRPYKYRPQEVLDLENATTQIGDLIAREAYQEAADRARQEMQNAPILRDNVIADHAADLRRQAEEDIAIAEDNEGFRVNQDLWNEILETRENMRESNTEQAWEDVIEYGQEIVDGVRTLLLPLRNQSNADLVRAETEMRRFGDFDASEHVPNLVVESQRLVATVDEQITLRQFRLAIRTAEEALTKINETIVESMHALSNIGITQLEDLIADVVEHGGDFRLVERYSNFTEDFDALLNFFYNSEYEQALAQIRVLRPVAQQLVVDTYRSEADELLTTVAERIRQLEDAEVRVYLPDTIEAAIALHEQAQERFDAALGQIGDIMARDDAMFDTAVTFDPSDDNTREKALMDEVRPIFSDSVQLSYDAGVELESIHTEFRELAERHLAEAQTQINIAVDLQAQFRNIWDPRVEQATHPEDEQFLQNRGLLRQEIETTLESARIKKATGEFRLNDDTPRYNVAIQLADEARGEASQVQADIYTLATRYALLELAWMLEFYEGEGAGEYVPQELDRTRRLIADTRQLLEDDTPREAVARAADARAQLEIMIQSLRRVANEEIQELRSLEQSTASMLGEINAPERLELISAQLQAAEDHARRGELKDAIETAQRGRRLAQATTTEAGREWAQRELDDARARIAHAEDAGAATYAPTDLQEARELADTARRRFADGDNLGAQLAAAEAALRADEARLALISGAEEAVLRARDYDGFRFHFEELADSQVAVQRAIGAMNAGEFEQARELSRFAADRADQVTDLSQTAVFMERVRGLSDSIEHAMATGSAHFQPTELEAVLDDLTEIRATYTTERHDDFERDLETLEARMAIIIEGTPEILTATLDSYRDWIRILRDEDRADLYAHAELEEVAGHILAAQRNFGEGHHRVSYRETRAAGRLLQSIQIMADEFQYKDAADDLLGQLESARYEFADYIKISPRMFTYMAALPGGSGQAVSVVSGFSPTEFRREMERLQGVAAEIAVPPTRADHHTELLACLRNAELAARNFEYLGIADQLNEIAIRDTVESAYDFLETSRRQSEELNRGLLENPLAGPVTMTEEGRPLLLRALDRHGYGFYYTDNNLPR